MIRSILAFATAAALVVAMAAVVIAADPNGATGHGADVSAVAKAVHTTQGNAHGKAVSAIASAHGKAVSAAAQARAAADKAAGQAKGAAGKANGQANNANGAGHANGKGAGGASEAPADVAPAEPGRVKDSTSGG
jgi:predicted small secreted protein